MSCKRTGCTSKKKAYMCSDCHKYGLRKQKNHIKQKIEERINNYKTLTKTGSKHHLGHWEAMIELYTDLFGDE